MKHFDDIRQILDMMQQHELAEFELEQDDFKIRLRKSGAAAAPAVPAVPPAPPPAAPAADAAPRAAGPAADPDVPRDEHGIELAVVKSPIVGTFYRAPEPGAPNFVEVGDPVRKGQVLCIIEAMKLMNEIESEFDGEIASIYVDNELPVQYGERLFAIKVK